MPNNFTEASRAERNSVSHYWCFFRVFCANIWLDKEAFWWLEISSLLGWLSFIHPSNSRSFFFLSSRVLHCVHFGVTMREQKEKKRAQNHGLRSLCQLRFFHTPEKKNQTFIFKKTATLSPRHLILGKQFTRTSRGKGKERGNKINDYCWFFLSGGLVKKKVPEWMITNISSIDSLPTSLNLRWKGGEYSRRHKWSNFTLSLKIFIIPPTIAEKPSTSHVAAVKNKTLLPFAFELHGH